MSPPEAQEERWARHPTYPQIHASSHGRIWREEIINRKGHRLKAKFLSASLGNRGYLQVGFIHEGERRAPLIHRLVAEAFFGPIPPHLEVDHIDAHKTNNHLSNLQLLTKRENTNKHYGDRLNQKTVDEIRTRYAEADITQTQLAAEYNISQAMVSAIWKDKTWKPEALTTPRGAAR